MKKTLLLLVALLTCFTVNAQVAGYMGKRFNIGYSVYASPTYLYPSFNSEGFGPGINILHCADAEYVIKQRTSMCFSVQFGKTGVHTDGYSTGSTGVYYRSKSGGPMVINLLNFGIGFKFFGRPQLAPLGKYKKLDFLILASSVSKSNGSFYTTGNQQKPYPVKEGTLSYKSFAIGWTFGRQRIFSNILVLDTGFRFGIMPGQVFSTLTDGDFAGDSSNSLGGQIGSAVKNRLFFAQLFNLHIGIGFLAF